jgi:hypothetical protein
MANNPLFVPGRDPESVRIDDRMKWTGLDINQLTAQ